MRNKIWWITFITTIALIYTLTACSPAADPDLNVGAPDGPPAEDGAGQEEAAPEEPAAKVAPGEMNLAALIEALGTAGASVEPRDPVEQPFFSVEGQVINVDGQDVQVFEYADQAARQAESDTISEDGTSVGTSMMMWIDTPHFFIDSNLIVLYVGSDQNTIDLLTGILGAPIGS